MHRPEHLPSVLGWPLTHLRCRLPRLVIAAGRPGAGGEQVQQGLFGDADTAADADRTQFAATDRLVELVAADPQDGCGLAGGEHLGQGSQRAGGAGEVERRRRGGGSDRRRIVARFWGDWPLLLLGAWCCRRRWPVCLPSRAAGVGPYLDPTPRCVGCFPWWEGSFCCCWPWGERAAAYSRWGCVRR